MSSTPPPPPPPPPGLTPPPGYVPYGGFGGFNEPTRPIGTLSKWLVWLLVAMLASQALSLVVQLVLRGSAVDYVNDRITKKAFEDKFVLFALVSLLAAAAAIAQTVVLIVWTFRMAKNLRVLGRTPQAFQPGLTIVVNLLGGCTLGIANFFMWRELWQGSDPDTPPNDPTWKQRPNGQIVLVHLVLTLASVLVGLSIGAAGAFTTIRTGNSKDVADQLANKFGAVAATGALQIAVAVVFIVLVRQLSARHMKAIHEG